MKDRLAAARTSRMIGRHPPSRSSSEALTYNRKPLGPSLPPPRQRRITRCRGRSSRISAIWRSFHLLRAHGLISTIEAKARGAGGPDQQSPLIVNHRTSSGFCYSCHRRTLFSQSPGIGRGGLLCGHESRDGRHPLPRRRCTGSDAAASRRGPLTRYSSSTRCSDLFREYHRHPRQTSAGGVKPPSPFLISCTSRVISTGAADIGRHHSASERRACMWMRSLPLPSHPRNVICASGSSWPANQRPEASESDR